MLFYRFFLKRFSLVLQTDQDKHASTIQEKLERMGSSLDNFKRLISSSSVMWRFFLFPMNLAFFPFNLLKLSSDADEEEISVINWPSENPPPL